MIFLSFSNLFHRIKWTIFVNVSVLHQTGKHIAMSSPRIARDSFCYRLKRKEMHTTVERTSKKQKKCIVWLREPLHTIKLNLSCRQKWTSWQSFFACPMYIEGELKPGYNRSALHFHAIFTLYRSIGPQSATTQNTHIHYTAAGMASTATKTNWRPSSVNCMLEKERAARGCSAKPPVMCASNSENNPTCNEEQPAFLAAWASWRTSCPHQVNCSNNPKNCINNPTGEPPAEVCGNHPQVLAHCTDAPTHLQR